MTARLHIDEPSREEVVAWLRGVQSYPHSRMLDVINASDALVSVCLQKRPNDSTLTWLERKASHRRDKTARRIASALLERWPTERE